MITLANGFATCSKSYSIKDLVAPSSGETGSMSTYGGARSLSTPTDLSGSVFLVDVSDLTYLEGVSPASSYAVR